MYVPAWVKVTGTLPDDRSLMSPTAAGGLIQVTLWVTALPHENVTVPPAAMSVCVGSKTFAPPAPTVTAALVGNELLTVMFAVPTTPSIVAVT